jgi:hypothetical protein
MKFAVKKSLQDVMPPVAPIPNPATRQESDTTLQQLSFYSLNSPLSDRFLSPIESQAEASTVRLKPLRLVSYQVIRPLYIVTNDSCLV